MEDNVKDKEYGFEELTNPKSDTDIGADVVYKGSFNNDFGNDFKRDIMAMKTKQKLENVFCGVNSLWMKKGGVEDLKVIDFDFDMPALVDSINYSEGEPTTNPVKIHGLNSDWCTMYEAGEATFSVSIPTAHNDVLEFFWGKGEAITSTVNGESWSGHKYDRSGKQMDVAIGILSADKTKLFVVDRVSIVASNVFESGSTQPHLVQVTGSVTSDNFLFLSKEDSVEG